jgi:hypothetical protein
MKNSSKLIRAIIAFVVIANMWGIEALAASGSKFISQVLPQNMKAGQEYTAVIQFRNLTNSVWSQNSGIVLGLLNPRNRRAWKISQIELDRKDRVGRKQTATFRFTLKAPKPGVYNLKWKMRQGRSGWFGDETPVMRITVTPSDVAVNAEFVYQQVPGLRKLGEYFTILEVGKVYPVMLTFKNTGTKTWLPNEMKLKSQNPPGNLHWSVDHISFNNGKPVKPGEIKTFNFKLITPLEPGIYNFQWQMHHNSDGWIGEPSDNVAITVR